MLHPRNTAANKTLRQQKSADDELLPVYLPLADLFGKFGENLREAS